MGCLYTALIGYLPFFGNIPLEVFYIFIGVGLSALLVSTDRGNAKAKIRGTGIRLAPRLNQNMICILLIISNTITKTLRIDTIKFPLFFYTEF